MKPATAIWLIALGGLAGADFLSYSKDLPGCALTCAYPLILASGCKVADSPCICSNQSIEQGLETCVYEACTVPEARLAARVYVEACEVPRRSRQADILAPLAIQILAVILLALRFYSRWITIHRFEADDYIMAIAGIVYILFVVIGHISGRMAFGQDFWWVKDEDLTAALKLFYADEVFYLLVLCLTKVSILIFYLRIFPQRRFHITVYGVVVFIALSNATLIFLTIFQCRPINLAWGGWLIYKEYPNIPQCLDIHLLAHVAAGISILHDIILILLPMPLIAKLNTSARERIGIGFMLGLGVFVLITSCVRLRHLVGFARHRNATWYYTDPLIWSGVEASVSVIITSLPALRILLKRSWPNMLVSLHALQVSVTPPWWSKLVTRSTAHSTSEEKPTFSATRTNEDV